MISFKFRVLKNRLDSITAPLSDMVRDLEAFKAAEQRAADAKHAQVYALKDAIDEHETNAIHADAVASKIRDLID